MKHSYWERTNAERIAQFDREQAANATPRKSPFCDPDELILPDRPYCGTCGRELDLSGLCPAPYMHE